MLEMKVPSPGESITEVEIAEWLVQDGDYVEKDQAIAEVDSDKATLELPAEASGIITLKAEEGDAVAVGAVVCLIDTTAAKPEGTQVDAASKDATQQPEKVAATQGPLATKESYATGTPSPAAKKILDEKSIASTSVTGSGRDGRITKHDALNAVPSMGSVGSKVRGEKRTKLSMLRRKVAERLVEAKNTTAMLTTFNEVDMSEILSMRASYKEAFEKKYSVKLGFMSFFVKAAVESLKKFPTVNAYIDGEDIVYHAYCDVSVAVSSDRGLVVPVLRDAHKMGMHDIEKGIVDFAVRAQDGTLGIEEMSGGTFTISNGGVFGSLMSTPILNSPQSAILGMHKTQERPVVVNGEIVIRPMMYLALSYDHRIIDGKEAVQFLISIKEALEDPARLLLKV